MAALHRPDAAGNRPTDYNHETHTTEHERRNVNSSKSSFQHVGELSPAASQEVVMLLHGVGANGRAMMWLLQRRFRRAGYRTVIWSYPSFLASIKTHGTKLHQRLGQFTGDESVARVHLVTHSLGGIVARYALTLGMPTKLGRFVMLAPPNQGSSLAAFFGPLLHWCCPSIDQLGTKPDSFINRLPEPEGVEIGVIAASVDLLVGRRNTQLLCQRDHIVLPAMHVLMIFQRRVFDEVLHFLAKGRFSADAPREPCMKGG